ncbi:SDR family oxidoreductase [Hymenobacter metallilatus]|uniref:SDR family oxidoreductase n=1 Tax=Hymenobacter metallilatus TaxID=2493666 RepID=A0A3R9M693_9BACT|nr:SDR family oxidoreductase [Hymenobacter metallilatus]RSK33097.1 SDR family oxidoreductase [Hymenobacter metallilatus]
MILITGATGHIGSAVIERLLQLTAPGQVAGLVRDEAKAADLKARGVQLRVGNYRDPASLERAMQGVSKVLLVSGGSDDDGLQQHYNVVDAAKKAGVGCLAYTGRALQNPDTLANPLMVRHFQTEDYIRASGVPYVLFRNILYMDTLPQFVGPQVFEQGIQLPAGMGEVAFALRQDMGEAIANVLADSRCDNRIFTFTGSTTYSFTDVAAALSELSGKPVAYTPIEQPTFEARLQAQGLPNAVVHLLAGFLTDIKNGQESTVSPELADVLGRPPTPLKEGLKAIFKL